MVATVVLRIEISFKLRYRRDLWRHQQLIATPWRIFGPPLSPWTKVLLKIGHVSTTEVSTWPTATVFPARLRCPFLADTHSYRLYVVHCAQFDALHIFNIHNLYTWAVSIYARLAIYCLHIRSTFVHHRLSMCFPNSLLYAQYIFCKYYTPEN